MLTSLYIIVATHGYCNLCDVSSSKIGVSDHSLIDFCLFFLNPLPKLWQKTTISSITIWTIWNLLILYLCLTLSKHHLSQMSQLSCPTDILPDYNNLISASFDLHSKQGMPSTVISTTISHLMNRSLCHWTTKLLLSPLYLTPPPSFNPFNLDNYCPISNLPFVSKLKEKVIASKLPHHLV